MREILMYGEISSWSYEGSAAGIDRVLREIGPTASVRLRVHSPGGSPYEAAAIRSRLEAHKGTVKIIVDGLAASAAASLLATSGADVSLTDGAFVMIHNASALAVGDAGDLAAVLNQLRAVDKQTAELFARRTKKSYDEIVEMMDRETWMTAQEAVEAGFANRVISAPQEAVATQRFELGQYHNVPVQLADNWTPPESKCEGNHKMDPKIIRQRLGLPETATDEQVYAALDARPAVAPAPAPAAATQFSADAIRAMVTETVTALTAAPRAVAAHADAVQAAVERAIADGKVRPAQRDRAVKACGDTAAQLTAQVEYWAECPVLVPAAVQLGSVPNAGDLSPMARRMAKESGVKLDTIKQIMAEENEAR